MLNPADLQQVLMKAIDTSGVPPVPQLTTFQARNSAVFKEIRGHTKRERILQQFTGTKNEGNELLPSSPKVTYLPVGNLTIRVFSPEMSYQGRLARAQQNWLGFGERTDPKGGR